MILVTGATGTVGSEVVKRLSPLDVPVRAVTRDPARRTCIDSRTSELVQADFEDVESMRRACLGVDRAFLLTNSTERTQQQQLAFTRVAQESGVRHIVKLSQLHADARTPGRFLRYHAAVEEAVQASGLTVHVPTPESLHAGPAELPPEYPAEERHLRCSWRPRVTCRQPARSGGHRPGGFPSASPRSCSITTPRSMALIARAFDGQPTGLAQDDVLDNATLFWLTGPSRTTSIRGSSPLDGAQRPAGPSASNHGQAARPAPRPAGAQA